MLDSRTAAVDAGKRGNAPAMMGTTGATARRRLNVDTIGQVLAVLVTLVNEHDRAHGAALSQRMQEVTGKAVDVAFVDQGDTGEHLQRRQRIDQ